MREIKAVAIFNPQNPLEQAVQDAYYAAAERYLTAGETLGFIEAVVAYDGLYEDFLKHPQAVSKLVFDGEDAEKLCIPCHVLELRQILRKRKIVSNYKIAALRLKAAHRLLNEYPILLVLDESKLKATPQCRLKGVNIYDNTLEIGHALIRVMCREPNINVQRSVDQMIAEEYPAATAHPLTDVPGMAMPKAASHSHKYIVNITALGIKDRVVKAPTPEIAVQETLLQEAQHSQHPHDPKYTVEYWQQTMYWPYIVREASSLYSIKMAADAGQVNVALNDVERKMFQFLLAVNEKYKLGLTFRVAGGWVRDKILNPEKDSDDIDIALDKMTGAQFGKYLTKEIGKHGNVIKANPDQSKHLETMTINLFGQDVDFVNLRSETYGDSRIPEMEFGTPEVDALRRDLTINALFYNLNTGSVEDLTGTGLADLGLQNGQLTGPIVLRTPMDPVQTFTDDPLRILRMLRFQSRYKGSQIDPASIQAMKQPEVQQALKTKVSPERIYKEWHKMFGGHQPDEALRILYDTGLWNVLFGDKLKHKDMGDFQDFKMDQRNRYHTDNVFEHTLKVVKIYNEILRADGADDDERARSLAAAFMHDLGKLSPEMNGIKPTLDGVFRSYHGHEDISALTARAILNGLKASNEDIDYITKLVQNHMIPHQHGSGAEGEEMTDKRLRKLVRELGRNMMRRIIQHAKADATSKPGADSAHYDKLLERTQTIEELENKKPVVDGRTLIALFPTLNPASGFIREINDKLQDMQDENPNLTEQDYLAVVEQMRPELMQKYQGFTVKRKVKGPQSVQNPPRPRPQWLAPNAPTPTPQQVQDLQQRGLIPPDTEKTAQTWYEDMKHTGEKPNRVSWMCGSVVYRDRYPGTKNHSKNVILCSESGEYVLRMEGGPKYDDEHLKHLVGRKVCVKGKQDGYSFTVSQYVIEGVGNKGMVKVERERPSSASQLKEGDKVRHRHRGLAFKQIDGIVEKIKGNLLFVKWDGIEEQEVFRLDDTVSLHAILQKI
jgi:tRNA nucleotidyltransferase/poly(A) polymerase